MRFFAVFFLAASFFISVSASAAAPVFPALTGRVVDNAHLLSAQTQQQLEQQLAAYEKQSSNQVVVVTLPSLQNLSIEDYGYQLGRQWGIGQKGKNNGVILLVAPQARKVRIEVGYGLEGTLTDAMSSRIVQSVILPRFRQGQMEQGIVAGTQAIVQTLGGQWSAPNALPAATEESSGNWQIYLFLAIFLLSFLGHRRGIYILPFGMFRGGSGGGNDDSFSGGGGSFGGGGSSGSW